MSETLDYLDRFAKVTADVVLATVTAPPTDDEYYRVELIDSRGEMLASNNVGEWFAAGSRVLVHLPSASRSVVGATAVIVSRAPREQRGLSATTPAVSRDYFDQSSVTGINPDPLVLIAGGDPETHVIMGAGLDEAAEYVGQGPTGVPPNLTNTAPPVVTPTKVTMTVAADEDSPLGNFDIVVSGVKLRGALRIEAPAPGEPDTSVLWALGYSAESAGAAVLLRVAHGTMEVASSTLIENASPVDLVIVDSSLYVLVSDLSTGGLTSKILRINSDTGAIVESWASAARLEVNCAATVWGDVILFGDIATGNTLYGFDTSTETETSWDLGVPTNAFARMHVAVHGDIAIVTNTERLIKFDLATSTLIDSDPFDTIIEVAVGEVAAVPFIYALRNAGSERVLSKIDFGTLAVVLSVDVAPNNPANEGMAGRMTLMVANGFVYGSSGGETENVAFRADLDTLALTAADLADDSPGGVFAGEGAFEIAFTDFSGVWGGVLRLDAETLEVLRRDTFAEEANEITRVLIQE